ncbi:DUF5990 family protein [Streptomyces sp. NBC_01353]|uniref:DUF5990 family protein n=1 Tax=Streptomyces sp. NBC_01353 TaxID=2903835 RepID=UPI002E3184E8|nr:DUF5990 family protein [Streptomyces sp. NBC_01353]
MAELFVRIVGDDLPGRECGEYRDVHVAVQRGRDPEGAVPGDAPEAVWEFTVRPSTPRTAPAPWTSADRTSRVGAGHGSST